jgi:hypothetical protein
MSSKFDWRAEDDLKWNEFTAGDSKDEQPDSERKRPAWLIISGILVLVVTVGIFAFFQVRRYVEDTAAAVEEDVLSSHALVKMAAQEDDLELFAPLLSGRDPKWTQDQLTLLDMDLLLDRQPLGLTWKPQEATDNISVTLSPDLQSAEIEYIETYGYGLNGEEGDIQLAQTAVYRLSETRWLLSPPNDDFWGEWISSQGRYVILTFPERDAELGRRLAADLEATLAGACFDLDLECDNLPHLDVLLTPDLEAMMALENSGYLAQEGEQLRLPTPTLVGKPANNVSYRALYRGYATLLLSHLVARQANWNCCDQSPFFKALVDVQLHQLGFQSWPLTAEDYRTALRHPPDLTAIRAIWDEGLTPAQAQERPEWWMLYTFIEFVVNQQEEPAVIDLQRALAETNSFNTWLDQAGINGSLNLMEGAWQAFIHERILQTQAQPTLAWPEEDIALICNDGQTGIANIYRYQPTANSWTVELADRDFVVMNGLPDNQGLILTEQFLSVDQLRTTLWRDGQETAVSFGSGFYFSAERSDPEGRYLVLSSFQENTAGTGDFVFGLHLLELANCNQDSCPLTPIEGEPVWSPDGSQTLWSGPALLSAPNSEVQIYLGDEQVQAGQSAGIGFAPFWLDDENYAFLQNPANTVLMAAGIVDRSPEQILETADLISFLPEVKASDLLINDARVDPTAPNLVYLTVSQRFGTDADYLFTLDWQSGKIELVLTAEEVLGDLSIHSFSPNHRHLALTSLAVNEINSGGTYQEMLLIDRESQRSVAYTLIDTIIPTSGSWSNNGQWFLFLAPDYLMLSAPEAGYDHFVPHKFRNCTGAAWIK